MRKYFYTLAFILTTNVATIYSQSYQSSLMAEVAGLATNKKDYFSGKDDKEFISAYTLSYNGKIRLSSKYQLVIRTGYFESSLINDSFFSGVQLGLFLRRKMIDSLFCSLGIDSKINFKGGHGTAFYTDPKRLSFLFGGTIGLKLNKDFSILLSFYKTIDENYGYGQTYETAYYKYLYWLMKLGVELNL